MTDLLERIQHTFPIQNIKPQKPGLMFFHIDKTRAETLLRELRDGEGYQHLSFITATDYMEDNIFTLTYMLYNYDTHSSIGVHVDLPRDKPEMETLHHLWAQVETYERELREMFGIQFPGSPRLNEDLCLEAWEEIPPMRREFDTVEYSERTYFSRGGRQTYDPRRYMEAALYPEHVD